MTRSAGREGVILVDKPAGPTSHDVVAMARRHLGERRVGHSGTLDPFASGLLLLCVGRTTRLVEYLHDLPKEYEATLRLGVRTTTDDLQGEVLDTSDAWTKLDPEAVRSALAAFQGTRLQTPPAYSAKKVAGLRAHARARSGEVVDLRAVPVTIERIEPTSVALPDVSFRVRCSTGTYIRAIARDLGDELGVGGHLTTLRRTAIGPFGVDDAIPPDQLGDAGRVGRAIRAPLDAVAHLPRWEAVASDVSALEAGQKLPIGPDRPVEGEGPVVVTNGGELLAVAVSDGEWLRPRKVFPRG